MGKVWTNRYAALAATLLLALTAWENAAVMLAASAIALVVGLFIFKINNALLVAVAVAVAAAFVTVLLSSFF